MATTELLLKLINEFAKDGVISEIEKMIIKEKAIELGIDETSLDILIQMELTKSKSNNQNNSLEPIVSITNEEKFSNEYLITESKKTDIEAPLPKQIMISILRFHNSEYILGTEDGDEKFNFYYSKSDDKSRFEMDKLLKNFQEVYQDGIAVMVLVLKNEEFSLNFIPKNGGNKDLEKDIKALGRMSEAFRNYRENGINYNDIDFVKCIDFPNILIKTKSELYNLNLLNIVESNNEHDLEYKKFELKAFFGEKFINDWWGTPEYKKENIKKNEAKKLKEQELEEEKNKLKEEEKNNLKEEEKAHQLKMKRLEEENNLKFIAERDRMNNKEYEDRQTIYQQKELEKLKQNNTDSDSHDYFSLNRNASNVGSANSSAKNEFSSSVLRGGDVINPDKIIIENGQVTWKKRSKILIGGDSITIPLEKIASVELKTGVIGTDIIIRSNGRGSINAENFATADAKQIKSLLGF